MFRNEATTEEDRHSLLTVVASLFDLPSEHLTSLPVPEMREKLDAISGRLEHVAKDAGTSTQSVFAAESTREIVRQILQS